MDTNSDFKKVPIDQIKSGMEAFRPIDPEHAAKIARNTKYTKRLPPILLRKTGADEYALLGGGHRVAALRQLGKTEAWAEIITADDQQAEMNEIADNLERKALSKAEKDTQTARLVELIAEADANCDNSVVTNKPRGRPKAPTTKAAEVLGITRQEVSKRVNRNAKRHEGPDLFQNRSCKPCKPEKKRRYRKSDKWLHGQQAGAKPPAPIVPSLDYYWKHANEPQRIAFLVKVYEKDSDLFKIAMRKAGK